MPFFKSVGPTAVDGDLLPPPVRTDLSSTQRHVLGMIARLAHMAGCLMDGRETLFNLLDPEKRQQFDMLQQQFQPEAIATRQQLVRKEQPETASQVVGFANAYIAHAHVIPGHTHKGLRVHATELVEALGQLVALTEPLVTYVRDASLLDTSKQKLFKSDLEAAREVVRQLKQA